MDDTPKLYRIFVASEEEPKSYLVVARNKSHALTRVADRGLIHSVHRLGAQLIAELIPTDFDHEKISLEKVYNSEAAKSADWLTIIKS